MFFALRPGAFSFFFTVFEVGEMRAFKTVLNQAFSHVFLH
jgi:hypothetical protein